MRRSWKLRLSRDVILFATGVVGILHETFFVVTVRPDLLILFAGLVGMPFVLRKNGV